MYLTAFIAVMCGANDWMSPEVNPSQTIVPLARMHARSVSNLSVQSLVPVVYS